MANLEDKSFTYTVKTDGTVDYKANADGKTQNLSGCDLSSSESLEQYLANYTEAYVAGLKQQKIYAGPDIVIDKPVAADATAIAAEQAALDAMIAAQDTEQAAQQTPTEV